MRTLGAMHLNNMIRLVITTIVSTLCSCSIIRVTDADKKEFKINADSQNERYMVGKNIHVLSDLIDIEGIDAEVIERGTLSYKIDSEEKIQLAFDFDGHKIVREFKGKLADNEFKLKTRLKLKMCPPILWALIGDSGTIFKNGNDELVIFSKHRGGVFLTLLPIFGSDNGLMKGTFKAIN